MKRQVLVAMALLGGALAATAQVPSTPGVPAPGAAAPAAEPTISAVNVSNNCCSIWDYLGVAQVGKLVGGAFRTQLGQAILANAKPLAKVVGLGPSPASFGDAPPGSPEAAAYAADQDKKAAAAKIVAIEYLGTLDCKQYPEVVPALLDALNDNNEPVRFAALKALHKTCDEEIPIYVKLHYGKHPLPQMNDPLCPCCSSCQCQKEVLDALTLLLIARDEFGCYKERSRRVRKLAALMIKECLTNRMPPPIGEPPQPEQIEAEPPPEIAPETPDETEAVLRRGVLNRLLGFEQPKPAPMIDTVSVPTDEVRMHSTAYRGEIVSPEVSPQPYVVEPETEVSPEGVGPVLWNALRSIQSRGIDQAGETSAPVSAETVPFETVEEEIAPPVSRRWMPRQGRSLSKPVAEPVQVRHAPVVTETEFVEEPGSDGPQHRDLTLFGILNGKGASKAPATNVGVPQYRPTIPQPVVVQRPRVTPAPAVVGRPVRVPAPTYPMPGYTQQPTPSRAVAMPTTQASTPASSTEKGGVSRDLTLFGLLTNRPAPVVTQPVSSTAPTIVHSPVEPPQPMARPVQEHSVGYRGYSMEPARPSVPRQPVSRPIRMEERVLSVQPARANRNPAPQSKAVPAEGRKDWTLFGMLSGSEAAIPAERPVPSKQHVAPAPRPTPRRPQPQVETHRANYRPAPQARVAPQYRSDDMMPVDIGAVGDWRSYDDQAPREIVSRAYEGIHPPTAKFPKRKAPVNAPPTPPLRCEASKSTKGKDMTVFGLFFGAE